MAALRLFLLFFSSMMISQSLQGYVPASVDIDLDAPASQRWIPALNATLSRFSFERTFEAVFASHNTSLFNNLNATAFQIMGDSIRKFWPEQAEELDGISAAFATYGHYVSYEYLAAWAYYHDIGHSSAASNLVNFKECTGVLVQDETGHVIHGRNMDQSPAPARNITLHLYVFRSGVFLYEVVDWYWFTGGFETAAKKDLITMEENWRLCDPIPLDGMLEGIQSGIPPQVFQFRFALDNPNLTSFDSIVGYLGSQPLLAPCYYILSGPGESEGVVLTRNYTSVVNGPIELMSGNISWYLVQTNYDHWLPDPKDDPRRTAAETLLKAMGQGQGSTPQGVAQVISTSPVLNPSTLYSVIMDSRIGILEAAVRT